MSGLTLKRTMCSMISDDILMEGRDWGAPEKERVRKRWEGLTVEERGNDKMCVRPQATFTVAPSIVFFPLASVS